MKKDIPDQEPRGPTDVPPRNAGATASTDSPRKSTSADEDTSTSHPGLPSVREGPATPGHKVADKKRSREESQPKDKDTTASHHDLTGGSQDSTDEPSTDPREPFLGRASIDRRVSSGEIIHTLSPDHLLANLPVVSTDSSRDVLVALGDAMEAAGKDSYSAEPRPDPREPMSRRSTIDRCISQGIVIPTSPSLKSLHSYTGSSSSTPAPFVDNLKGDVGAADSTAQETVGTPGDSSEDVREPMSHRASIDRSISMGKVIRTRPSPSFHVRSISGAADATSDVLDAMRDALEEMGKHSCPEPRPDPREPLSRRSTIDQCISEGIVIPTAPSVKSLHSFTGSASISPAQLVDHLKEPRSSPLRPADRHQLKGRTASRLLLTAGLVVFALVLVALSVLVVRRVYSPFHTPAADVCDSEDCVQHASAILASLNRSADPCVDFHAHVCGRREDDRATVATLAHIREVFNQLGDAQAFLASNRSSSAAAKAFAAVSRCNVDRGTSTYAEDFVKFMRERGIPWPRPASTSGKGDGRSGVLDVLLDLAINWRVALWFDVTVSMRHDTPVIIIGDIGDIPALRMEHLAGADGATYNNVVRNLSLFLSDGKLTLNDAEVKDLHNDETLFRRALLFDDAYDAGEGFDDLVPVSDISTVFGQAVSPAHWAALLDKYLNAAINVSAATEMLIVKEQQFARVGSIVGSLPYQRLLNVLGWTFAYAYAWTVNTDFDVLSAVTGDVFTHVQCFVAVQESFGIVQSAPMFQDTFDANERSKVIAALSWTSASLVELVKSSLRLAESTKLEARSKIASLVSKRIWPPEPYLHASSLDVLYANFSDDAKSFFEAWLQSRKALRAALASPYYGSLMTSRYRWRSGSVQYVYALNEVWLGLSAVFPPSYLRGGSATMTYAGFGFQLARQLVRSVDLRGRQLDRAGRNTTWWFTKKQGQPDCRLDQAKTLRERRLLGDLFALEVALVAMRTSSEQDPDKPLRLKSLEMLTATQTFYVSYCSHHCGKPSGGLMCNLAMNATDFQTSFKCDRRRPKNVPICVVL